MVIEQPSKTKKTILDHIIEEKYRKNQEPWDIPNPSSYLYMDPSLSILKSSNPFNGDGQTDEMIESIKTSQEL